MTIVRTPAAQKDILEIWRYVAERHAPAADDIVRRFDVKMTLLERHPLIGQMRDGVPNMRSIVVDRYVMFYRPIDDGIEVLRVLHGARDIAGLLSER